MRAWQVPEFGHYHKVLRLAEQEKPTPQGTEALVQVTAAGINFPDILFIAGQYQIRPPLPFTPGLEIAGRVVAKGESCRLYIGDRVMAFLPTGGFAEFVIVVEGSCWQIPDTISDAHAGAMMIAYQTAYFALTHRAGLQAGEILLVHGGSGGVGLAAIQLGKALGAMVIATAGTAEKLEICRENGADHLINYRETNFVEAIKSLTKRKGADVIYDPVGGEIFDQSIKCIAWGGRIVVVGFASGEIPKLEINRVLLKNISVVGINWGAYFEHNPSLIFSAQQRLFELYEEKKIRPVIYREIPFAQLPDALKLLEDRKVTARSFWYDDRKIDRITSLLA